MPTPATTAPKPKGTIAGLSPPVALLAVGIGVLFVYLLAKRGSAAAPQTSTTQPIPYDALAAYANQPSTATAPATQLSPDVLQALGTFQATNMDFFAKFEQEIVALTQAVSGAHGSAGSGGTAGVTCSHDKDCSHGQCVNGLCSGTTTGTGSGSSGSGSGGGAKMNAGCKSDADCLTGNCSHNTGTCRPRAGECRQHPELCL